jgi:CHAT domain-containing protein
VLEAKKGRVVAEVLTASNPQFRDPEARKEIEAAKSAQDQAAALQHELLEEQAKPAAEQLPEKVKNLTTLLAQTKGDYLKQVQTFLAKYPQYRTQFVDQQSVDPRALAKFADRLPEGTLAVQFFPSPDALYLFVVAPGGRFQVKRQAVTQAELYKLIKEYRAHLDRGAKQRLSWADDGSDAYRREVLPFKELTRKLSEYLLGPIATELVEHKNLVLIPNDLLLYLPIHALANPAAGEAGKLLAETHVISYLTQLELADIINPGKPRPDAPLLALANPDGSLPAASREIREIGKIRLGVTTLDGEQATKERFLSLAGKFPDLHLATHGVLDPDHPERSYLLMAGLDEASQRLTIAEIAGLRLQPHGIAILSACETAVGEQVPGAALITMAAAFSQAGSQSIMASLWEVGDAATRDLMVAFYGTLSKTGRAGALHQAQLTLLKNPLTAHPYYWAPFILIGAR